MEKCEFEKPSLALVQAYNAKHESLTWYYKYEEEVLMYLIKRFPTNDNFCEVLIKVTTLNDFYSTNIKNHQDKIDLARFMSQEKNFDKRLKDGDLSLVEELTLQGSKKFYSFATKYCSMHEREKFPIYDSIVAGHLSLFNKSFKFTAPFSFAKLKNYEFFVSVVDDFREYFGLQKASYREIDRYLWGLAKIKD